MSETYVQYRSKLMSKLDRAAKALAKKLAQAKGMKQAAKKSHARIKAGRKLVELRRDFWREWMAMPENRSWPGKETAGVGRFRRAWNAAFVFVKYANIEPVWLLQEYQYLQDIFRSLCKTHKGETLEEIERAKAVLDRYHLG